ncbi:MAG TPA: hypothetical protein VM346_04355, partial [Sphingomicrobium sp.]|nr:hypothetical protein [Sphingomicrobium sp.]
NFSNHRSFYRNGGSPNVWALADAGVTRYPSSDLHYAQEYVQLVGTTFDCEVWKDPGGPGKGPDAIFPPGLQTTGHATVTGSVRSPAPDYIDPNGGPMNMGGTMGVQTLICISPNTGGGKPGQWRGMHDFATSGCAAASVAAGGTVPSGNNPD